MDQVKNLVKNLTVSDGPYKPPGRLGDPNLELQSDPRARPDLVKAAVALGLGGFASGEYPDPNDVAKLEEICRASNDGFSALYEAVPCDLPEDANEPEIEEKEVSIDGPDGNKIKLRVYRTKDTATPKPGVCYIHGGGMTILNTFARPHVRWVKSIALQGTVAILIDFRNAWQPDGTRHKFPAGLNDCAAAVKYVDAHRSELGISKLILQGESGGGNLCLATALKANKEGWVKSIDGVYGSVPYISGGYGWSEERKLKELPSLVENDGYLLAVPMMVAFAKYYSPGEGELEDPLAWPYHASVDELKGLPPHLLSMDELDPLRDEGIAYARKLVAAGVEATAEVNLGITHGSSLMYRHSVPEINRKAIRHIAAFAHSV